MIQLVLFLITLAFVSVLGYVAYYLIIGRDIKKGKGFYKAAAKNKNTTVTAIKKDLNVLFANLEKAIYEYYGIDVKIVVSAVALGAGSLNANAAIPTRILVTPNWVEKIFDENPAWMVAFVHTIGHETGHKREKIRGRYGLTRGVKAINWVRESNCDFCGVEFACRYLGVSRAEVVAAAKMKAETISENNANYIKGGFTHPSWELRIDLLETFEKFDEEVTSQIKNEANPIFRKEIDKKTQAIVRVQL